MNRYRILENGELLWEGRAHGPNHAEEKCFWDESPGSLCRYTLQVWKKVRCASQSSPTFQWVSNYENQRINCYV